MTRISKRNIVDQYVLIVFIILSVILSLVYSFRPLTSALFFFLVPSLYMLARKPVIIKRVLAGSLLFGLLFGFALDFVALLNSAWSEPINQLFFKDRIFGVIAADHIIWFFLWVLVIICYYEHFFEHERSDTISPHVLWGLIPAIFLTILLLVIFFVSPDTLKFRYAYLILGIAALVPLVFLLFKKPRFYTKFAKTVPYFFFLFLAYELVALYLGQWEFPGQYIGHVTLAGLSFPFEEFFFWILLSSPVILSYYEIFIDDGV